MPDLHLCHADNCTTPVPPRIFMCRKHWFMVPMDLRGRLLAEYQPGQEKLGEIWPSDEYLTLAFQCVDAVSAKEQAK